MDSNNLKAIILFQNITVWVKYFVVGEHSNYETFF